MIRDQIGDVFTADGNDDEHREVYARFGLAYYLSECIHRGLVNVFAYLPYDKKTATRPWVDERYARASAMTLGELAAQVKPMLPATLQAPLDWTVERRNHLAHGFWYERTHEMLGAEGRAQLVAFLTDTADRFHELNHAFDGLVMAHLERLGISAEMFQDAVAEVRGQPPDPPSARSVPKTEERLDIVQAWLIGKGGALKGLVLRDREGLDWQLGEVGLGWCFLPGPTQEWDVFKDLQRHLPAAIVARPKGAHPWDYKLHLSTGPLLAVSRGADGIMRFAVRSAKGGTTR